MELFDFAVLVDAAAGIDDGRGNAGEVLARVDPRLPGETHAGPIDERRRVDVLRVESQLEGGRRFVAERRRIGIAGERRVQVAVDPGEVRVDPTVAHDLLDLCDRGETAVPDRPRVVAAELPRELGQPRVRHHGQVRTCVSGVVDGAAVALEQRHPAARQPPRGTRSSAP